MEEKELSPKQILFIDEYMKTLNATRAYMSVSPKSKYDSARASAAKMLSNANVKAEIKRRIADQTMTKPEVLTRLSAIANVPVEAVDTKDILKAIEMMGRYYKLFTDKVETTEKKVIRVTIKKEDE